MNWKCVNEFASVMKYGRVYKAHDSTFKQILILNDLGRRTWQNKENFVVTDEKETINEEESLRLRMLHNELDRIKEAYECDVKTIVNRIKDIDNDYC